MNATKQLLTLLRDKGPQSVEQMAASTGLGVAKVREVIKHMREHNYLQSHPVTYSVSPKGALRASAQPAIESKKRLERMKAREAGITAEAAKTTRSVAQSIQRRPALEQAWGVFSMSEAA